MSNAPKSDVGYLESLTAETQSLLDEIRIPLKKNSQSPFKGTNVTLHARLLIFFSIVSKYEQKRIRKRS